MKGIKGLLLFIITGIFLFNIVACTNTNATSKMQENKSNSYPITVKDMVDRDVEITKKPLKIISLAPSNTEILFALGAGKNIVGVTDYDNYPTEVKKIDKVGGFRGANLEAIAAKKPDVIFAGTTVSKEEVQKMEQMGLKVIISEATSFNQVYDSIKLIGRVIGKDAEADKLVTQMQQKVKEIEGKTKDLPKVKTYYAVQIGQKNWTAGKGTFINDMINMSGGENVASDVNGWSEYSIEKLVKDNPQILLVSPQAGDIKSLNKMQGYKDLDAVKNDKVIVLNDDLISRPGPRIVKGLESVARALHPEVFR